MRIKRGVKGFTKVSVIQVVGLISLFVIVIGIMLGIMFSLDSERHTNIVKNNILKKSTQKEGFSQKAEGLQQLTLRSEEGVSRPASFGQKAEGTQQLRLGSKKRIGIANMMKNPIDLPLWLKYHRNLGISKFFIRLEDSPSWEEYLKDMDDVYMEVGASDESGNNYTTVIDRQVTFVNSILRDTQKTKDLDWLIHIDGDELIHGDIDSLMRLSNDIKTVKFANAEAIFKEPKKRDSCFTATNFLRCDQGAPCKSYVNGKAAGRTNDPNVYLAGCHDFGYKDKEPSKTNYKMPFETLHVLHFEGCSFGGWVEKFYHMSKGDKGDMPFPYYKESIQATQKAHDMYKANKMPDPTEFGKGQLYSLYSSIKI